MPNTDNEKLQSVLNVHESELIALEKATSTLLKEMLPQVFNYDALISDPIGERQRVKDRVWAKLEPNLLQSIKNGIKKANEVLDAS